MGAKMLETIENVFYYGGAAVTGWALAHYVVGPLRDAMGYPPRPPQRSTECSEKQRQRRTPTPK